MTVLCCLRTGGENNHPVVDQRKNRICFGGIRLSTLHVKGVFTITLFILADSVSFTNGMTGTNTNNNNNNNNEGSTILNNPAYYIASTIPSSENHYETLTGLGKPSLFSFTSRRSSSSTSSNSVPQHRYPPIHSVCAEDCPTYRNESNNYYNFNFNTASAAPRPVVIHRVNPRKRSAVPSSEEEDAIDENDNNSCESNVRHTSTSNSINDQTCGIGIEPNKSPPRTNSNRVLEVSRGGHGSHQHTIIAETIGSAVSTTTTTPFNIPLNGWKIIFQAMLTAINVFCWLVPLKSKHIVNNQVALSIANSFSGGVFLSLAFGHLIPECVHGFDKQVFNEATPYMLVLVGYMLIFFVEKVAFDAHDILHEMESKNKAHIGYENGTTSHIHSKNENDHNTNHATLVPVPVVAATTTSTTAAATTGSGRGAVILLGALAVHSILEMMALGLADTFGDCALLTLSISLHQPAESIALLVAFLKSGMSEQQVVRYLSIFSCMGPIGVLLGILVNAYASPIVDSIMLAIVAGTFVYVGATEVIPEEFEDSTNKWTKFSSLMAGIVSIFVITQYTMTLGAH